MSNNRRRMKRKAHRVRGVNCFRCLHKELEALKRNAIKTRDEFLKAIYISTEEIKETIAKIKALEKLKQRANP